MKKLISLGLLAFVLSFGTAYAQYGGASAPSLYLFGVSGPGVDIGETYSFSTVPQGFSNPQFTVTDLNPGTGGTQGTMEKGGYFSWKPTIYDAGSHTLVISATDVIGHTASTSVSVLIRNNSILLTQLSPGSSVHPGDTVTLTVLAPGFVNPTHTVFDATWGTTISATNISATGAFSWKPTDADMGTHKLLFISSDPYGHQASASQMIVVVASSTPPAPAAPVSAPATSAPPAAATTTRAQVPAAFVFVSNLASGARGNAVLELQKRLGALGFLSSSPTGYFGPATAAAVKKFQKAHGVSATGSVGPATRNALNAK